MIYDAFALNVLFLEQTLGSNQFVENVEHYMIFAQTVAKNFYDESVSHELHLTQLPIAGLTINQSVSHALAFTQSQHPRSSLENLDQLLFMWTEAVVETKAPLASSQLSLSHEAAYYTAKPTSNILTLMQEVVISVDKVIHIEHTLVLSGEANAYLPSKYWISEP